MSIDLDRARRLVRYLADRGWLARVRRGLYVPVPLEARRSGEWHEDPWIVAAKTYAPCYIGGWSACEHWALTDQLFRRLVVVTTRPARARSVIVQGTPMRVKVVGPDRLFGTSSVWRGQVRVDVSNPTRTVVDVLDDPALGGGIRHVAEVLSEYLAGGHRDDQLFLEYATRIGNGTIFKRMGFLIESLELDASELAAECHGRITSGITALDPTVRARGRIMTRWHLRANVALDRQRALG